ncbi:NAD(P)-dependent dehydrogenase, short-chain alcohol dehydrogenase family [Desulfatibacillum alkenivorans DSM 16219]|jgi:NAD(P)-dependent dehydrogenase (short-subunit alcohol dehydrogenase family)|uniref:NAD(P)-dependent dehydrogenase, short-chain alcohol dehydrogenase family n=1 Tax=Desulfatibacillum alkenivorans DSM 16219 TaxID=1121393 RepID=A0A1M6Q3R9_9BACT|nr:SDR family oxidoreductase [Desulfatibacillum alkenivorans]SHK14747.1 NAD(P)-dependent dehydrogenase, short-chain alcohol dehydrogenase family [Desulfatibacillum alkenivorans DSM 16219]
MAVNFSLEGKIALITGASRGIGEAIAHTLAENGAHCILVSRKAEALEQVARDIRDKGGQADVIPCHMGYVDKIEGLFQEVDKRFGKLDILVNNAAANPYYGPMEQANEGVWDKTLDVNLKGPFFMCQYAAPLMRKGGGGAIVNTSSVNGINPAKFRGIYSITKAALIMLTRAYAMELGPDNIRVNALLPGLTRTKFAQALFDDDDVKESVTKTLPMRRHAEPIEMAGAVLYLVSEAGSYTTGATLTVDGGSLCRE